MTTALPKAFRVRIPCKIQGLRISRLMEWSAVLSDNRTPPGLRDWWRMTWLVFRSIWLRPDSKKVRSDYSKCIRCPIHDPVFKRCGANDGLGCGCYQPFSVVFGKRCWLREQDPKSTYGY